MLTIISTFFYVFYLTDDSSPPSNPTQPSAPPIESGEGTEAVPLQAIAPPLDNEMGGDKPDAPPAYDKLFPSQGDKSEKYYEKV